MDKQDIIDRIHSLHPEAQVEATGSDCSFEVLVIDPVFDNLGSLKRQQPILALFRQELGSGKLHALSVRARTPEEQHQQGGLVGITS